MAIFGGEEEVRRKANLKKAEDKRVAFAQRMAKEGFAPQKMLMAQTEKGALVALAPMGNRVALIVGPEFGADGEFEMEMMDRLRFREQEVHIKGEGMGGIFGFGKKAEIGVEYYITRQDGTEVCMPFVSGRNCWLEVKLARNPLLKTQRRRGDANVVWDLRPIDKSELSKVLAVAQNYFVD